MPQTLQRKLNDVLTQGLDCDLADLETLSNGHVCGHVVSKEFDGLDFECRRKRIRDLIDQAVQDNRLTRQEALQISTLLTYTPIEWSGASMDLASDG